jgi:aminobenzoyl-glutamate utilization protein A
MAEKKFFSDAGFEAKIREYRRDFHKYAEARWTEYRTASLVAERLAALGVDIKVGTEMSQKGYQVMYPNDEQCADEMRRAVLQGADAKMVERMDGMPGVLGVIDSKKPGPVVAFRFDMDALTTSESDGAAHFPAKNGFRSVNDGYCHACGHDGHTAIGLGLAEVLMSGQVDFTGRVKLIFQPGEEGGAGAHGIVAAGVLDDADYFFAVHVGLTKLDGIPLGSHGLICGVKDFLDARGYNFTFIGKPAHPVGDPHVGKNALLAACSAALAIHSIPPHSEGMCRANVGVLHAGVSKNTIAPSAYMMVDMRGSNDLVAGYIDARVLAAAEGAAKMYDNELVSERVFSASSAKSDDAAMELVGECAGKVEWFNDIHIEGSMGGSDDAAEMLRKVQSNGGIGSYIGVGADFAAGYHNGAFDFDEEVMIPAIKLLAEIVRKISSES